MSIVLNVNSQSLSIVQNHEFTRRLFLSESAENEMKWSAYPMYSFHPLETTSSMWRHIYCHTLPHVYFSVDISTHIWCLCPPSLSILRNNKKFNASKWFLSEFLQIDLCWKVNRNWKELISGFSTHFHSILYILNFRDNIYARALILVTKGVQTRISNKS